MNYLKEYKKEYKQILKLIKQFNTIVVYRHIMPDFDAAGTQNGLVTWLKDSFPNKKIYSQGKDFYDFTPFLYPHIDEVDVSTLGDFLAIVVDTGNGERIDNDSYKLGKKIIKFDHHPAVEQYGDINVVDDSLASCSELVVDFISYCGKNYPLSMLAGKYFYSGIVGDSGRFLYSSTNIHTFKMAELCLKTGFDLSSDVYLKMYEKDAYELEVQKYILNNYHISNKGVAYYVLKEDELKKMNLRVEQGKKYLSMLSNIKGIDIWLSISEDTSINEYRVSIRSKKVSINSVAEKYRGGGHAQASGAKLSSLDELDSLINDLEALL